MIDLNAMMLCYCLICERSYCAPLNVTVEDCCPECVASIERSHGYDADADCDTENAGNLTISWW